MVTSEGRRNLLLSECHRQLLEVAQRTDGFGYCPDWHTSVAHLDLHFIKNSSIVFGMFP